MAARIDERTQFVDSSGAPIVNGFIYIGTQGTDPTIVANQITIFSDRALTTVLANPQFTDSFGRSVNKIWIPGQYSIKVENANNVQMLQDLDAGELTGLDLLGLDNVLGSDTITAEGSPTITSLTDQALYSFKVTSTNTTTTVTLNIDSIGAKSIVRNVSQAIEIGQFVANDIVVVQYNSTNDDFTWFNENTRVFYGNEGADIVSASTVDLSAATGNTLSITGKENIDAFGTVSAGAVFNMDFPGNADVTITSSSVASPTNILCAAVHGGTTGDIAYITGHSGSVPSINGMHVITVVDTTNYTIPVNVTTGGTGGTSTLIPSITFNATSMLLPGDELLLLPPGSDAQAVSLGSGNWRVLNVQTGDGSPVKIPSKTEAETGTDNFKSMTPLRTRESLVPTYSELFTASGTYDVPEGVEACWVEDVGSGAGGGGATAAQTHAGGGGGGGQIIKARVAVTPGSSITITIGAAGTGGVGDANGVLGGDCTFGSLVTAKGGSPGIRGNGGGTGGLGGTGSTPTSSSIIPFAHPGEAGVSDLGGRGGSSPNEWEIGQGGTGGFQANGSNGTELGSGGGGGGNNSGAAKNGGDGVTGYILVVPIQ